jgi:hypothetical protein
MGEAVIMDAATLRLPSSPAVAARVLNQEHAPPPQDFTLSKQSAMPGRRSIDYSLGCFGQSGSAGVVSVQVCLSGWIQSGQLALEAAGVVSGQVYAITPDDSFVGGQPCPLDYVVASGRRTALAGQILSDAIGRYRRPDGYEGHLVEAAWELGQIGWEAWPVLRELVLAGIPECEYFLGALVRLEGVSPQRRLTALLAAARNPDANVRSRLLELLDEMPDNLRGEVLRELTAKGRPDDGVTDRAREALGELAS